MKKLTYSVLFALFAHSAVAQTLQTVTTAGNTTSTFIVSTSQVGYRNNVNGKNWDWGATSVDSSWRLNNTGNRNVLTILSSNGNVGIGGVTVPAYALDVAGTGNFSGVLSQAGKPVWHTGNFNPATYLSLSGGNITGNIVIGTTAAQKQLDVNGNIKTRRVQVTQVDWADYVFDSTYCLMSLPQVENYIASHKHLPEVPSAAIVKTEGIDLGDNQVILLKKIEELTLYIIEQNKRTEALTARLAAIEQHLNKKALR